MSENRLLVFLKNPVPGAVKTRLAASVGEEAAARIYKQLVAGVFEHLRGSEAPLEVHFDPPNAGRPVADWLRPHLDRCEVGAEFHPQVSGDLGNRLASAVQSAFDRGAGKVAVIGTDCLDITPEILRRCWSALDRDDVVLGPTRDGGYYLVGLRQPAPELFADIPWSTPSTLEATLRVTRRTGLRVTLLDALSDIDTEEDWRARCANSGAS